MVDISKIKSRLSCVEFAHKQGLPIKQSGDRCVSPLRPGASNQTSFVVYDEFFFDFGAGEGGDVIDFAAKLLYGDDKGKAIRELAKLTGTEIETSSTSEWVQYTQNLCKKIQYEHEHLTAEDRQYLYQRGLTDETINRIKIGRTKNGRLCIPYWKNGYVCYYATRYLPGGAYPQQKYKKMPIDDYNDHTVWGLHTLDRDADRKLLVIAEGAFDALSFEQEGYSVISAITGHFSREQLSAAISIAKSFKQVFIVYDNDKVSHAGEKFTLKMAQILTENRIPCIVGTVPATYKDVSEYYADGGKLGEIIAAATDAVEFLASKITTMAEFEPVARKVCRYMSKPSVDMFFKAVERSNDSLPADWLKSLCKDCKSAPLDKTIADEITAKHKLAYNPSISFFEYTGNCWEKKSDHAIERYIKDALGPYATGSKLASIARLIKAQTETSVLFNMGPVVNFINGTLELFDKPPYFKFREHRETDYCTYCLSYPYKPGAHSPEWESFIDSVTESDGRRISFLQEFSGYVLFPDNKMQKCAALVGSGSNGKSVFFGTMSKVFGAGNVTNITMSKLSQDFQTIHLLGSMLNISAENKSDAYGAEETFKQVVAGDDIFACYKGKDYIKFRPRTKMILSLNNYPKISDKSDAFARRLAFIEFPLKFVEVPKEPDERPLDRNLADTLSSDDQLSAIFNWVLDGYVMVRKCGYITETDEHQRVLGEFKEESDPTITFVKEVEITFKTTKDQMYDMYKQWCFYNGYKPEPSKTALRLISRHFKEYRKDIEPYVSNSVRGFKPV